CCVVFESRPCAMHETFLAKFEIPVYWTLVQCQVKAAGSLVGSTVRVWMNQNPGEGLLPCLNASGSRQPGSTCPRSYSVCCADMPGALPPKAHDCGPGKKW